MSKRSRDEHRAARRAASEAEQEPDHQRNAEVEIKEIAKRLAEEGYRVWSLYPEGQDALTKVTDEPKPWGDWETRHNSPTRPFKDVDGTTKRLNVSATIDHYVTNQPQIRSVSVTLEQQNPANKAFLPLVAAHSSGAEAGVSMGAYGEKLYPDLDQLGAYELLASGLDRAEIEVHKRRPSAA